MSDKKQVTACDEKLNKKPRGIGKTFEEQLVQWKHLYKEHLGIDIDTKTIKLPEQTQYYAWLIVVAKGVTIMSLLRACQKFFSIWLRSDKKNFDSLMEHCRDANKTGTYAIAVNNTLVSDITLSELREIEKKNGGKKIPTITVPERLLIELMVFINKGKQLDFPGMTFCLNSRYIDNRNIPVVFTMGRTSKTDKRGVLHFYGGFDNTYPQPCIRLVKLA